MMSKEILMVADAVSNEKGVSRAVIFEAIESALASATKKLHNSEEIDCRVSVDQETGDYETFRVWTVVEEEDYLEEGFQFTLDQASDRDKSLSIGDIWEEKIENAPFGRIAAQTAKQVIVQKVRKRGCQKGGKDNPESQDGDREREAGRRGADSTPDTLAKIGPKWPHTNRAES